MKMAKRGRSLADIVAPIEEDVPPVMIAPPPQDSGPPATAAEGPAIVPINILVSPADRKRLRQLSLDSGLSLQKLGHEAWNLLLRARGLPPLEPVAASVPSGRSRRAN